MKNRLIWKLLLVISVCPYIAPFFYYAMQRLLHDSHTWTLTDMLVLWSFVYWPTYLIGLVLFVISVYKLKK